MQVNRRDGSDERRILIGMIVDRVVLGRISTKWEKDLFSSKWANLVAGWCHKFFEKYNKAPGKAIEGLFESWASRHGESDTVKLVEKLLSSLDGEYRSLKRESNSDYIIDLASNHFNKVKLSKLAKQLEGAVDNGELDDAVKSITSYNKLEMGLGSGINVLQDKEAVRAAFAERRESIIKYHGDLGTFLGDSLERDGFIALVASAKKGKTFVLMDMAWRAMEQRRKVAFFQMGDLSQNQSMRRFMIRAARRPYKPGKILYPIKVEKDPDEDMAIVEHKEKEYTDGLDWRKCWKSCKEVMESKARTKEPLLKLSCHAACTLNVHGIRGILQNWERTGWVPDVVIIDYADLIAPIAGYKESRDQVNATWTALRSLSTQLHCLTVAATQADAGSYTAHTLHRSNFSNDRRKNDHVTGMIGINQSVAEKEMGLMRWNWVVPYREGDFKEGVCVHVAGCLAIANPCIRSTF